MTTKFVWRSDYICYVYSWDLSTIRSHKQIVNININNINNNNNNNNNNNIVVFLYVHI